jgi:hypothetical protein
MLNLLKIPLFLKQKDQMRILNQYEGFLEDNTMEEILSSEEHNNNLTINSSSLMHMIDDDT